MAATVEGAKSIQFELMPVLQAFQVAVPEGDFQGHPFIDSGVAGAPSRH